MPITRYGYNILADTLNGQVDSDKLTIEISISSIVTSHDHISTSGADAYMDIFFSNAITSGEKVTLDAYVAAHDGYALVNNLSAVGTNNITTTSTSYIKANDMALTPFDGTYVVYFSGSFGVDQVNTTAYAAVYVDGTVVDGSERIRISERANDTSPFDCIALITINGSQAIEGKWKVSNGTGTMYQRTLVLKSE